MSSPRIRIGHTAAPALLSRVIRGVTGAPVSHSFLSYASLDHGLEYILEAEERRGVVGKPAFRRLLELERDLVAIHELLLEANEEAALLHQVALAAGGRYDWGLNVGLLFAQLGNRLAGRRRWVPRWNPSGKWNCSETIASALRSTGLLEVPPAATPGELFTAIAGWRRARPIAGDAYLAVLRQQAAT